MSINKRLSFKLDKQRIEISDSIYALTKDNQKLDLLLVDSASLTHKKNQQLKIEMEEFKSYMALLEDKKEFFEQKELSKTALLKLSALLNNSYELSQANTNHTIETKLQHNEVFENLGVIEAKSNPLLKARQQIFKTLSSSAKKIGTYFQKVYENSVLQNAEVKEIGIPLNYKTLFNQKEIKDYVERFNAQNNPKFKDFYDTMHDFGINNPKTILNLYHQVDKWTAHTPEQFLRNKIKQQVIDQQISLFEGLQKYGIKPDMELLSITDMSYTEYENLKTAQEILAPKSAYQEEESLIDFNSPLIKEDFSEKFNSVKDNPLENNTPLMNINLARFNGVEFDSLQEWANYSIENNIASIDKASLFIKQSLDHAKELEKIGLLKAIGPNKYTFVDSKAREILLNNYDKSIQELHAICQQQRTPKQHQTQTKESLNPKTQNHTNHEQPATLKAKPFTQEELKKIKRPSKTAIDAETLNQHWKEAQEKNKQKSKDTPLEEQDKNQQQFIYLSCVKFKGISLDSLEEWKEKTSKYLGEETTQQFISSSLEKARELVKANILIETAPNEFKFLDGRAREILYENYEEDIEAIKEINQEEIQTTLETLTPKQTQSPQSEFLQKHSELITRLKEFDWNYDNSPDVEYRKDQLDNELKLIKEVKNETIVDPVFREEIMKYLLEIKSKYPAIPPEMFFELQPPQTTTKQTLTH